MFGIVVKVRELKKDHNIYTHFFKIVFLNPNFFFLVLRLKISFKNLIFKFKFLDLK
jgi:hypothetical protein